MFDTSDIRQLTLAIPGLEVQGETKFPITRPAVVRYTVRLHGVRVLEDASEERFREFATFLLLHRPTQAQVQPKIDWDKIISGTDLQTALINALRKIAKPEPFLAYAEESTYGTQPEKPAVQMIDRIEARADEALRKYPTGMPLNKDAATLVAIRQMCREVKGC